MPPFAWAEGENPTQTNFNAEGIAFGPEGVLSGGKWLFKTLNKEELAANVPADGLLLRYDMTVPQAGSYDLWARVGFESARPPLQWRIGDGTWQTAEAKQPTTGLVRLGFFVEAGWLKLGAANLPAGTARVQLRYKDPASDGRLLIGLDALALVGGAWQPEGRLQPGQQYEGEPDKKAAAQVFQFATTEADPGPRQTLTLNGLWQVARWDDPDMDMQPYKLPDALPKPDEYALRWQAVNVPSSAWNKPELAFGHRLIYRCRVNIPSGKPGATLHFSGTNWIAGVWVNGQWCQTHKGVLVPWDCDISKVVRPGQLNEIAVVIKSPYYAIDPAGGKLNDRRSQPREQSSIQYTRWVAPVYPSSKGEGDGLNYGLVNPVTLTLTGAAYVSDVFVTTSVSKHRLDADVTVRNTTGQPQTLTVQSEAQDARSGQSAHTFAPVEIALEPNSEKTVAVGGAWTDAKLWWPINNPSLYRLRTRLVQNGQTLDSHNQTFGFREVTLDGTNLRINGVPRKLWNWVEVSGEFADPASWLAAYRKEGNRYYRFSADSVLTRWFPAREAMLDFCDRNGVCGRLSTCVDGMFITYDLNNPLVWENFNEHLQQVTRAYRGHPSMLMYSVENELLYINAQNTGQIDMAEPKVLAMVRAAQKNDATLPYMADGGGALKTNELPINCEHYAEAPNDFYPENAYTLKEYADHSSRWPWDRQRPLIMGEMFFLAGKQADQAWIGGDRVFRSRRDSNLGASKTIQMLIEGYRWAGVTGMCPWVALANVPGAERVFRDLAVFPRRQAYRLRGGQSNSLLVKVLNDSLSDTPIQFGWTVRVGGKPAASGQETLPLTAGTGRERTLSFTLPPVAARTMGELEMHVKQGEQSETYRKPLTILPPVAQIAVPSGAGTVRVLDRSGKLTAFLKAHGVAFTAVNSLSGLTTGNETASLFLIGPDTLTAQEATSTQIAAFAARGGRVIVLEQNVPLAGAALPMPVRVTSAMGGYAFGQAYGTEIFHNLKAGDLEDWMGDHPTYKHAYAKPSGGAKSLIECGDGLNASALIEVPCGRGVIALCQMRVGAKLGVEPAADQLLANLIAAYGRYTPSQGTLAYVGANEALLQKELGASSLLMAHPGTLAAALDPARYRAAALPADADTLRALNADKAKADAFMQAGGWIVLHGLTPDNLTAYNRLVGANHEIRPARVERLTLEQPEHRLAATLGNRDFTFYSTRELSFGDYWLSGDVYSWVIGGGDAAPFTRVPDGPDDPLKYTPTYDDHDPYNLVNGLLNSDSWRMIKQIGYSKQNGVAPQEFRFRQPATIRQVNLWNNNNYGTIRDMDIVFDGDTGGAVHVTLPSSGDEVSIPINPPRRVAGSIVLQVKSWRDSPRPDVALVGLDNVQFLTVPDTRPGAPVALDNVGGLVAYSHGKGGLLLCQLKFGVEGDTSENQAKKRRILSTLLQNAGVGTQSAQVTLPGVNVAFTTVDLTRYANRQLKVQSGQAGWFGDANRDLRSLPRGKQTLAGVEFFISDYVNAPVPQAIVLGTPNAPNGLNALPTQVTGIPVGRKADALYFLHTAQVLQPVREDERRRDDFHAPEVWVYVVHYGDGTTQEIPVRLGENVDDWQQTVLPALAAAQIAWTARFEGAEAAAPRAVVYAQSWSNPKPTVPIVSIDMRTGKDSGRVIPALLGLTVGNRIK